MPYDYQHPDDGRTFTLRVARQKAQASPTGKAVFHLAGGPGGTSVGQTGRMPKVFPKLRDTFDFVYVDQRGTGGSGYLGCPGGYPESKQDWIACGTAHANDDLEPYRTLVAAHDLESVRVRLGYGKIHLRGGSYGTRLGLEYLRQYESNVVAAVLDGLVPPDVDFFGSLLSSFDQGVAMLANDCAASATCHALVPDVVADLSARRAALKQAPRPIIAGGQMYVEDDVLFEQALEASLYDAGLYYRVPRAVHAALGGDPTLSGTGSSPTSSASRSPSPRRRRQVLRPHLLFDTASAAGPPSGASTTLPPVSTSRSSAPRICRTRRA